MRNQAATVAAIIAVTITGCSPHKVTHNPAPPMKTPAAFEQSAGSAAVPDKWWIDFGDPELNSLIASALDGNMQLRAAWARLKQAASLVKQARSAKWPQLNLTGSAARQEQRFNLPMIGQQKFSSNQFLLSAGASYEVDLWGKIASTASAAELEALAGRDDVEAIIMSIVAQVGETWFSLVELRAEKALLAEQLKTGETYLELVQLRFEQGLASALDVYQQQQQVTQTRARMTLIDSGVAVNSHALALLTGKPPGAVSIGSRAALPELSSLPSAGVPADLLHRRPDVRAARKRVEAADHRVAAAVADRLPGLRLQGSLSLSDRSITDLIAAPLTSLIASVVAPLVDGGRRKAEVVRNRAVVEERLWSYGQVLLQAMVEVENALVQEKQQRLYIVELDRQVEIAGNTLREARERYGQGLIDYLPVLTALQVEQQAQVAQLQAQRQLISYRMQLYRAVGGSWTRGLAAPGANTSVALVKGTRVDP